MDVLTNSTSINMNMYIQPANLPIKDISEFPSKQAEAIQNKLKELDKQGKLKEEFMNRYGNNLGKPNSLANYILKNWEKDGKKLFIEWTGIETFDDKQTIAAIGIKINEVSYGNSNRYFLWKCGTCKYEWVTVLNHRTCNRKHGCTECAKLRMKESAHLQGEPLDKWCNTQGEYGQQLKEEFIGMLEDGTLVTLEELSRSSHDKVLWKCSTCGYKWGATPNNRTHKKWRTCCPACAGNILIKGVNDLETFCKEHQEYMHLLDEFVGEDEKHNHILPSEIARGSNRRVYWKCNKCHKIWLTPVVTRTGTIQRSCPYCNAYGTSFPEQFIFNSLKQLFPNTKNRQKDKLKNYEYDIVIPELNLCIEYSGYGWHKNNIEHDIEKEVHCKSHNIQFLQIYSHYGEIKDTDGDIAQDTYTPSQIIYKVNNDKTLHIIQLQQIIKFILEQYAPNHSITEIDFELAEHQANKIMNKA